MYSCLKQALKCLLGKHDWISMYTGEEGTSRMCIFCEKTEVRSWKEWIKEHENKDVVN